MRAVALLLLLLAACACASQWHLVHDVKTDANLSAAPAMPMIQHASHAVPQQRPTVIIATPFVVPAGLHCAELVVDLPLKRLFPPANATATEPGRARFFLWRNTVPSGDFQHASLTLHTSWTLSPAWQVRTSPVMQRFVQPFANPLLTSGAYYLGAYVEQANYSMTTHANSVWWAAAAPDANTVSYLFVDVYGNFLTDAARAAEHVMFVRAPMGTEYYAGRPVPAVAMSVFARCTNDTAYRTGSSKTYAALPAATFGAFPPALDPYAPPSSTSSPTSASATLVPSPIPTGSSNASTTVVPAHVPVGNATSTSSSSSPTVVTETQVHQSPPPYATPSEVNMSVPSLDSSSSSSGSPAGVISDGLHLDIAWGVLAGAIGLIAAAIILLVVIVLVVVYRKRRNRLPLYYGRDAYRDDEDAEGGNLDDMDSGNEGKPARGTITASVPVVTWPKRAERNLVPEPAVKPGDLAPSDADENSEDEHSDDDATGFRTVPLGDQATEKLHLATRHKTGRANKADYISLASAAAGKK